MHVKETTDDALPFHDHLPIPYNKGHDLLGWAVHVRGVLLGWLRPSRERTAATVSKRRSPAQSGPPGRRLTGPDPDSIISGASVRTLSIAEDS